jgi:hypothetical protein
MAIGNCLVCFPISETFYSIERDDPNAVSIHKAPSFESANTVATGMVKANRYLTSLSIVVIITPLRCFFLTSGLV